MRESSLALCMQPKDRTVVVLEGYSHQIHKRTVCMPSSLGSNIQSTDQYLLDSTSGYTRSLSFQSIAN